MNIKNNNDLKDKLKELKKKDLKEEEISRHIWNFKRLVSSIKEVEHIHGVYYDIKKGAEYTEVTAEEITTVCYNPNIDKTIEKRTGNYYFTNRKVPVVYIKVDDDYTDTVYRLPITDIGLDKERRIINLHNSTWINYNLFNYTRYLDCL